MVPRGAEVGHINLIVGGATFEISTWRPFFLNGNRFFVLVNVVAGIETNTTVLYFLKLGHFSLSYSVPKLIIKVNKKLPPPYSVRIS